MIRYLTAHWNGTLALPWLLGINLLALRWVTSAVTPENPAWIVIALSLAFLIWQITGAARALKSRSDLFQTCAVLLAILITLLMAALDSADILTKRNSASPEIPTQIIHTLPTKGATIILNGPITFAMNSGLKTVLAQNPNLTTLHLTSDGGNIFAARGMVLQIQAANLNTHVPKTCASACTLIFAAGKTRTMAPDATLGFHGYRFDIKDRVQTLDIANEEAKDRRYLRTQGIPTTFIDKIFITPPNQLWRPTRTELIQADILTNPK